MRRSAWLHTVLAVYVWLVECVPLGNWNRQHDPQVLTLLQQGRSVDAGEWAVLLLTALPAVFCWVASAKAWRMPVYAALGLDSVWLVLQIQTWWIPYAFGSTERWQIKYAAGPTTKILPSFGTHVAPDAMHFVITVLILAAMASGWLSLRGLRGANKLYPQDLDPDRDGESL